MITRTDTNAELREKCKNDCDETTKEDIIACHNHFNENIKDLPASEFPDGESYKFWVKVKRCLYIGCTKGGKIVKKL